MWEEPEQWSGNRHFIFFAFPSLRFVVVSLFVLISLFVQNAVFTFGSQKACYAVAMFINVSIASIDKFWPSKNVQF